MMLNRNSISIILNLYKKDNISSDEAVQLIEDLYRDRYFYIPTYPQITWNEPQKFEVTCSYDSK